MVYNNQKQFNNQCQNCPSQAEISHDIIHKSKYPVLYLNVNNGIPHAKISYIYIHYAQLGGKFKIHTHDRPHFVHYQQVPINCGSIFFPDFEDEMYQHPPKEDKFLITPEGIPHEISVHKNTALGIAITGQLENLI